MKGQNAKRQQQTYERPQGITEVKDPCPTGIIPRTRLPSEGKEEEKKYIYESPTVKDANFYDIIHNFETLNRQNLTSGAPLYLTSRPFKQ